MFKFNFSADNTAEAEEQPKVIQTEETWEKSKQIQFKDSSILQDILKNASTINLPNYPDCKYIDPSEIVDILQDSENETPVLKAEQNHLDLIPAVYEGGLKIWECTYDLLSYLSSEKIQLEGLKVLDLGCGSGILGIYSLSLGATCYFQDYNEDVLQYFTIPNVLVNNKGLLERSKFYSGDWESFANLIGDSLTEDEKFDYIFTSETLYNVQSYPKIHKVFKLLLKKSGKIYLAAKSFYFGVGGGIPYFKEYLDKNKVFKYLTVSEHSSGVKRAILEIKFI
ncbi:unnamed protein product [Acanthoscelides obtectus]|uniref:protein-histidine N-methyltransferase n=2 Tax=Acanthoscelides obtectus TaxID=200917 RepID=A0A9P0Q922_ACAOB|nr:unnamed protein product [Acanthoscelides obtectus]CAK1622053.1 Histidine protein methyltransferase 1 homolog [Acanthoscelides obtectus]